MKPDLILFPDGSLKNYKHNGTKTTLCGYGVVALNPKAQTYATMHGELTARSTVYAELWAMYQGMRYVEYLRKHVYPKGTKLKVLIVSDSKLNIQAFTEWIPHLWDLSDYYNWQKSKDKGRVANQELYRAALKIMENGHYKVKFIHLKSHTKGNQKAEDALHKRLRKEGVNINKTTLQTFVAMNDLADRLAKKSTGWQVFVDTTPRMKYIKDKKYDPEDLEEIEDAD